MRCKKLEKIKLCFKLYYWKAVFDGEVYEEGNGIVSEKKDYCQQLKEVSKVTDVIRRDFWFLVLRENNIKHVLLTIFVEIKRKIFYSENYSGVKELKVL